MRQESNQPNPVAPTGSDLAKRVADAQRSPATSDDLPVLVGTGGRAASLVEVRAFVAREQQRIARERGIER